MKVVIFYEKPGCSTNKKQKKNLKQEGCFVIERNLLQHGMSAAELRSFFDDMEVKEWFNPNAPKIKTGEIDLSTMSKESALNLFFMDPILIKRPLMIINNKRICGFDQDYIESLLGISLKEKDSHVCSADTESCNIDKKNVS